MERITQPPHDVPSDTRDPRARRASEVNDADAPMAEANGGPSTEWYNMISGRLYRPDDTYLASLRLRARQLIRRYNDSQPDDVDGRRELLDALFGSLGPGAEVEPPFYCDYGSNIHAGRKLFINFNCVLLDCARIEIGDNVFIGPSVQLYAAYHPTDVHVRSEGRELAAPISIGNDVWIGGGAIICPGVRIGDGTTIGAGSVVTRDVPGAVVAAGNPCRVLGAADRTDP